MRWRTAVPVAGFLWLAAACNTESQPPLSIRMGASFAAGAAMPATFTCDAENYPPGLSWTNLPEQTQSLAILVEDVTDDAITHWLVYDIPVALRGSAERVGPEQGRVGVNDFGQAAYSGPCPPPEAGAHTYHFRVLALDTVMSLPEGVTAEGFHEATKGHVLAQGRLVATYDRR